MAKKTDRERFVTDKEYQESLRYEEGLKAREKAEVAAAKRRNALPRVPSYSFHISNPYPKKKKPRINTVNASNPF